MNFAVMRYLTHDKRRTCALCLNVTETAKRTFINAYRTLSNWDPKLGFSQQAVLLSSSQIDFERVVNTLNTDIDMELQWHDAYI